MRDLTPRQQAFADYYLETGKKEEAAVKAGYSKKYAMAQSYRLLENVGIREYVNKRLSEMSEKRVATAQEVMETLTRILRRESKETVVVTCKRRISTYDENGKKRIEDREEPIVVEVPTKNADVNKAAELLGKRYGLYTDKMDISGGIDLTIQVDYGDSTDTGQ